MLGRLSCYFEVRNSAYISVLVVVMVVLSLRDKTDKNSDFRVLIRLGAKFCV